MKYPHSNIQLHCANRIFSWKPQGHFASQINVTWYDIKHLTITIVFVFRVYGKSAYNSVGKWMQSNDVI